MEDSSRTLVSSLAIFTDLFEIGVNKLKWLGLNYFFIYIELVVKSSIITFVASWSSVRNANINS